MAFLLSAPGAPTRWEGCVQPPQHLGPQSGPWCDWPLGFCQRGAGVLCASALWPTTHAGDSQPTLMIDAERAVEVQYSE